jgi:hypothetical protein
VGVEGDFGTGFKNQGIGSFEKSFEFFELSVIKGQGISFGDSLKLDGIN